MSSEAVALAGVVPERKGDLPVRLVIIPVPDWSTNRPTSLTALGADGSDLNRQVVSEPLLPPMPVTTLPAPPTAAG